MLISIKMSVDITDVDMDAAFDAQGDHEDEGRKAEGMKGKDKGKGKAKSVETPAKVSFSVSHFTHYH
jgi:hypothetical protein